MEQTEFGYKNKEMGATVAVENLDAMPRVPEKRFKAGGISATVWKGLSPKGAAYYNIQLSKSYKDKNNTWKSTQSLKENEVPKAMVLLSKAYEYVILQQSNTELD